MLIIVVLAFVLAWTPVHTIHFLNFYVIRLLPKSCNSGDLLSDLLSVIQRDFVVVCLNFWSDFRLNDLFIQVLSTTCSIGWASPRAVSTLSFTTTVIRTSKKRRSFCTARLAVSVGSDFVELFLSWKLKILSYSNSQANRRPKTLACKTVARLLMSPQLRSHDFGGFQIISPLWSFLSLGVSQCNQNFD